MNKKFLLVSSIILVLSFSAGIFTEILTPSEKLSLSMQLPSLAAAIIDYLKSDLLTVFAAFLFCISVFLMPLVPLMVVGKAFSLGFSAAYILSSGKNAMGILLAALLPRGVFKMPAYAMLVIISYEFALFIKKNHQNPVALRKGLLHHITKYIFVFFALAISSMLEVFLLQGVL